MPLCVQCEILIQQWMLYRNYLCQGGYVIVVVCLLATLRKNVRADLHEIFREGWQWALEQMI